MKKVFAFVLGVVLFGRVAAQEPVPVVLTGSVEPKTLTVGSEGKLILHYSIDPEFHIGDAEAGFFKLQPQALPGWIFQEPKIPESEQAAYGGQYAGELDVIIPFSLNRETMVGENLVTVKVTYQPCSEEGVCYPPEDENVNIPVTVQPGSAEASGGSIAQRLTRALETGSIVAFLIVFLGGFLTSFTPCVYPMIPITIAVIGAQADGGRLKGFVLSLFYVLGLATMFTTLGLIAAKTGALFGSMAQHPLAIGLIGGIFLFMGLSMLGFYTVRVPSGLQTRLQGKRRSGFFGAYLTGIVAGVVVSPCVSPLLVVILTWVAKTGSLVLGMGLLFSFALGLGVLFILIGTFSGVLKSLPKTGGWMQIVEHGFGLLLVALALFFVRSLFNAVYYKALWGAALIVFATFNGAFAPLAIESEKKVKLGKSLALVAFVVGAGLLLSVVLGGFPAGPSQALQQKQDAAGHQLPDGWGSSESEGWVLAQKENKPLMLDFWADWCSACHELDERTWNDPAILEMLKGFVVVKIDQTKNGFEEKALQKKYGVVGLPTVIYLSPSGKELGRFEGFQPAEKVAAILALVRGNDE